MHPLSLSNPLRFQVETVGDKYMTVSGLPETCDNHAKCIARLALDLMDVAQNVLMGSAPVVSLTFLTFYCSQIEYKLAVEQAECIQFACHSDRRQTGHSICELYSPLSVQTFENDGH